MAYTDETLANAAYEALRSRGAGVGASLIPRIRTMIPAALELLGERVARGMDYEDMQADFTATPSAGSLDLSAIAGIIFLSGRATVRVASSDVLIPEIDDVQTLQDAGLPSDGVLFSRHGRTLRFRSITPSLTDYATAVKLRSNYVPSLTVSARPLPVRFEGAAVETLAGLVAPSKAEEMAA
jgi:hypothetical protein